MHYISITDKHQNYIQTRLQIPIKTFKFQRHVWTIIKSFQATAQATIDQDANQVTSNHHKNTRHHGNGESD